MNNIKDKKVMMIKKASGKEEPFETNKLSNSLHNAGADNNSITKILQDIENWIHNGVTTKEIYSRAFSLLYTTNKSSSTRYKLKQAIMELGPTGYPFEKFIGQIFKRQGFEVEVGVVVDGVCVTHEMDVIATKDKTQHLMECKYRKDQGHQISVQVPLYVRSRVNDIIAYREKLTEFYGLKFVGWVVTNSRFSPDSLKYGEGSGLKLLGWNYPKGEGLKDLIEQLKIYPITILQHLEESEKKELLKKGVVTCAELLNNQGLLKSMKISQDKYEQLLEDLQELSK